MSKLDLSFFGNPRIEVNERSVVLPRRKSVAMLAYLAVTAVAHSRIHLATLFWTEFDESRGLAYLRRTLWDINNTLGKEWLITDRERVVLPLTENVSLDIARFDALTDRPDRDSLQQAHALVQGEFLEGFSLRDALAFDDWQVAQRERLRRRYGICLQRLVGLAVADGELDTAVAYTTRWLALDDLNEEAHRYLMRLYVHLGRRATAVQQYESCVQTLANELGMGPEPATRALNDQIRQGDLPSLDPLLAAVVDRVGQAQMAGLPQFLTSFVGRGRELAQIQSMLVEHEVRLFTLVGAGGIGKTRLAVEAARSLAGQFRDGVCFVPLALLNEAEAIPFALADALGRHVDAGQDPIELVLTFLASRKLLLILDNFEHLLDGSGWVRELLMGAPQVTLLVTSRRRLGLPAEHLLTLSELPFPQPSAEAELPDCCDAMTLFADRARRLLPDFDLDRPDTRRQVARICQLVAGYPLALEIAASWVRWLPLDDIADELEATLVQLAATRGDLDPRHHSLRGVFETSWQMLIAEERQALRELAVFQGGFTREAAAALLDRSAEVLAGLVEKSLIQLVAHGRYTMHNVVRAFALEKLDQDPQMALEARSRHWAFYADFLARQEALIKGTEVRAAYEQIQREFANIRAGWQFALATRQFTDIEKTLASVWYYFADMSSEEGRRLLQQTAQALRAGGPDVPRELLWKVITVEVYLIGFYDREEVVRAYAPAIIDYWRQHPVQDWDMLSFVILGWAELYGIIDRTESDRLGELFVARAREVGDVYDLSRILQGMGWMHLFGRKSPDLARAQAYSLESAAVATEHGLLSMEYTIHWQLGMIALYRDDFEEALRYGRLSLAECREAGILGFALAALDVCIRASLALGRLDDARQFLREALASPRSMQAQWQPAALTYAAVVFHQAGRLVDSVAAISAYASQISDNVPSLLVALRTELERDLPVADYRAASQRGRTLDMDTLTRAILLEEVSV